MISACTGWRGSTLLPTGRLFRDSQAASNDRPWDNYRRFASFLNGWHVSLCAFVQLLLWSVPVSNARVRRATARLRNVTSVGIQSPLIVVSCHSITYFYSEIQDCPCTGAADVNGTSQRPTSRQNRRPEAADDAGKYFARKWRATAMQCSAGMHSHEYTQVTVKLCCRHWPGRVDVTCKKFHNRLYVLKIGYRLETGLPVTILTSLIYSSIKSDTF